MCKELFLSPWWLIIRKMTRSRDGYSDHVINNQAFMKLWNPLWTSHQQNISNKEKIRYKKLHSDIKAWKCNHTFMHFMRVNKSLMSIWLLFLGTYYKQEISQLKIKHIELLWTSQEGRIVITMHKRKTT